MYFIIIMKEIRKIITHTHKYVLTSYTHKYEVI